MSVISGYIHGSLTEPSSCQEWIVKRGCITPLATQRAKSSGLGRAVPANPPTSWPKFTSPDMLIPTPIRVLYFRVRQEVELSPLQVWT